MIDRWLMLMDGTGYVRIKPMFFKGVGVLHNEGKLESESTRMLVPFILEWHNYASTA